MPIPPTYNACCFPCPKISNASVARNVEKSLGDPFAYNMVFLAFLFVL